LLVKVRDQPLQFNDATDAEFSKSRLPNSLFLLLPWLAHGVLCLCDKYGMLAYLPNIMPYGLGNFATERAFFGVIDLFIGCSFLWAYRKEGDWGPHSKGALIKTTFQWGVSVAFIQIILFALIAIRVVVKN